MEHPELEVMDFNKDIEFIDSEEEDGIKLVEVTEQTKSLLELKRTQSVPNEK